MSMAIRWWIYDGRRDELTEWDGDEDSVLDRCADLIRVLPDDMVTAEGCGNGKVYCYRSQYEADAEINSDCAHTTCYYPRED